jgi:ferredoxin-NADP reductase
MERFMIEPTDVFIRITAKLNGEVTHYFHERAKVGDMIEALFPV